MPAFVPAAGHKRAGADRRADKSVIDELAAGLKPAAQKRIRSAGYQKPFFFEGQVKDGFPFLQRSAERFFV